MPQLSELADVPPPVADVPAPRIVADEHSVTLSYVAGAEGNSVLPPARVSIHLSGVHSCVFGAPNDEALAGHPLYPAGLRPYSVFEAHESDWLRRVERENRVHPQHDPELYRGYRYLIWTFHDSTFECLARHLQYSLGDDVSETHGAIR